MEAGSAPLFEAYPDGFPEAYGVASTVSLRLFIPGKPVPQARPRARVVTPPGKKPWVQFYEEKTSTDWQEHVSESVRRQVIGLPLQGPATEDFTLPFVDCRLLVTLRFNMPKPKGYPARVVHHTKKPDVDNLSKGVLDGLVKGRIMADDNAVTDLVILKRYVEPGHPEGVEVDLTAVPTEVP